MRANLSVNRTARKLRFRVRFALRRPVTSNVERLLWVDSTHSRDRKLTFTALAKGKWLVCRLEQTLRTDEAADRYGREPVCRHGLPKCQFLAVIRLSEMLESDDYQRPICQNYDRPV